MLLDQCLQVVTQLTVKERRFRQTFFRLQSLQYAPRILIGCGSIRVPIHTDKIVMIQCDCKGRWQGGGTVINGAQSLLQLADVWS